MRLFSRLFGSRARAQMRAGRHQLDVQMTQKPWRATHQHKKGVQYRVLAEAVLEADRSDVVIYDEAGGQIWVRSKAEFYDGRFSEL